jgi:hypothetical protein
MDKYILVHGIRIASDYKNFVPETFGRLTTLGPKFHLPLRTNERKWFQVCQCSCSKQTIIVAQVNNLKSGGSQSCGCYRSEQTSKVKTVHKQTGTKEYWVCAAIIQRCNNPNNSDYPKYGGRGITVCDRWLAENNGFLNFMADMGHKPSAGYTVERKDVNGNYCPENCVWATYTTQSRNRRNNRLITYNGKTQCLITWAEEAGLVYGALQTRLNRGWTMEEAMTIPSKGKRKTQ